VTSEGEVVGTLVYMSPEQALGKELDKRSDLYSLGAVLYEMCTGEPLVSIGERGAVLDAILHGEPKPIARLNYEVPEELERIVRKCLCKRSDERYQDVRQIEADLRALRRQMQSDVIGKEIARKTARSRLPWTLLAVGIPVVAIALLVAWWSGTRDRGPRTLPLETAKQLTSTSGWEGEAALSPDGDMLAYSSDAFGSLDIWIVDSRGGEPVRRTGYRPGRTTAARSCIPPLATASRRSGRSRGSAARRCCWFRMRRIRHPRRTVGRSPSLAVIQAATRGSRSRQWKTRPRPGCSRDGTMGSGNTAARRGPRTAPPSVTPTARTCGSCRRGAANPVA
jgi:hypothetical protein